MPTGSLERKTKTETRERERENERVATNNARFELSTFNPWLISLSTAPPLAYT